jgi:Protein of unknown function (DUF2934)
LLDGPWAAPERESEVMSAFPFGPSFAGQRRVLAQVRSRGGRDRPVARAPAIVPRRTLIAEAAYYRAERRGFAPGHELDDWLEAEAELARSLRV